MIVDWPQKYVYEIVSIQLSIFTFRPVIPVFSTKNSQPEEATQAKPMQVGLKPLILC